MIKIITDENQITESNKLKLFNIINAEVIPKLKYLFSENCYLPKEFFLKYGSFHGEVSHRGKNINNKHHFGKIYSPCIYIDKDYDVDILLYTAAHELAHFHDLSYRKKNKIHFSNFNDCGMWSEYFAHRIALKISKNKNILNKQSLLDSLSDESLSSSLLSPIKTSNNKLYPLMFILAEFDEFIENIENIYFLQNKKPLNFVNSTQCKDILEFYSKIRPFNYAFENFPSDWLIKRGGERPVLKMIEIYLKIYSPQ